MILGLDGKPLKSSASDAGAGESPDKQQQEQQPQGERRYAFYRRVGPAPKDVEKYTVAEKDLTQEQKVQLAQAFFEQFMGLPAESQDMFFNALDALGAQQRPQPPAPVLDKAENKAAIITLNNPNSKGQA